MSARKMGHIYKHGRTYWIKYSSNGKAYRDNSHSDKEGEAKKLLKKRLGEIAVGRFIGPDADKVTIRELAQDYLNDYRVNQKKSLDRAERMVRRKDDDGNEIDSELMAFFGDCKAHAVATDSIRRYIAQRLDTGAANATINRELAALKRMFNLGLQAEKIYRKPYIPMLKENNVRHGFFEYADFIIFREKLPEYFRPVVTFAYYTGWRKQEILSLKWNQVDLNARTVRLEVGTTKNDRGRLVMLDGELLETLRTQWARRRVAEIPGQSPALLCPYVFHRDGKPIKDQESMDEGLQRIEDYRAPAARSSTHGR